MLNKLLLGLLAVTLAGNIGQSFLGGRFKRQRDVARVELAAARVTIEAEVINTKTAVAGAARCAAEFADRDARCKTALSAAEGNAERARRAARACMTDEAVAARLGEVTR